MKLVIDIGNSLIKTALFDRQEVKHVWSTPAFDPAWFQGLLTTYRVDAGIVSTVKALPVELKSPLPAGFPWIIVGPGTPVPLEVAYQSPGTLGMDRLAGAVAASKRFPGKELLVMLAGTCLTTDFVDAAGVYQGGAISPGLHMRLKAMHHFTGKLPLVEPGAMPPPVCGKTTHESIWSGAVHGMASEMTCRIRQIRRKHREAVVVLSGGDAFYFVKMLKNRIFAVENLVLCGLNHVLKYNAPAYG